MRGLLIGLQDPTPLSSFGLTTVCVGDVIECEGHWLNLDVMHFLPGQGFVKQSDLDHVIRVHLEDLTSRSIRLTPGIQVICTGTKTVNSTNDELWLTNATLTFRPEFLCDLPWCAVHQFAGAYAGWGQAFRWLGKNLDSSLLSASRDSQPWTCDMEAGTCFASKIPLNHPENSPASCWAWGS